jgi:hypothetical protein
LEGSSTGGNDELRYCGHGGGGRRRGGGGGDPAAAGRGELGDAGQVAVLRPRRGALLGRVRSAVPGRGGEDAPAGGAAAAGGQGDGRRHPTAGRPAGVLPRARRVAGRHGARARAVHGGARGHQELRRVGRRPAGRVRARRVGRRLRRGGRVRGCRGAGGVDPRGRHQPAADGPDPRVLPLPRRRGRLQEDPRRGRRPRPVPRVRPVHPHLRAVQRGVVVDVRRGAAVPVARRRARALRELRLPDGRAGRERGRGRWRRGAGDHAAGHREDAAAGDGGGRGAAHAREHRARAAQGGRLGGVLPRAGAQVGVHVAVRGHHGDHLRVPQAALRQGRILGLDPSFAALAITVTIVKRLLPSSKSMVDPRGWVVN